MRIEKSKKPKHLSYVLKTSLFERVISAEGIKIDTTLIYWVPEIIGSILQAYYWIPNENVDYPRIYVRAGVVENQHRKPAFELLEKKVLPSFIEWLKAIMSLQFNSTLLSEELFFDATYTDQGIKIKRLPLNLRLHSDRKGRATTAFSE